MTIAQSTSRPVRSPLAAGSPFYLRDQRAEPDKHRWKVSCVENLDAIASGDVRNTVPA